MSLVGYYTASYSKLVRVFGEPNDELSMGYKVSTSWYLVTDDGVSFSLYDYKETCLYDSELETVEEFRQRPSYEWHIGSYSREVVESVYAYLNEKLRD
jgi:hypothetical protein